MLVDRQRKWNMNEEYIDIKLTGKYVTAQHVWRKPCNQRYQTEGQNVSKPLQLQHLTWCSVHMNNKMRNTRVIGNVFTVCTATRNSTTQNHCEMQNATEESLKTKHKLGITVKKQRFSHLPVCVDLPTAVSDQLGHVVVTDKLPQARLQVKVAVEAKSGVGPQLGVELVGFYFADDVRVLRLVGQEAKLCVHL